MREAIDVIAEDLTTNTNALLDGLNTSALIDAAGNKLTIYMPPVLNLFTTVKDSKLSFDINEILEAIRHLESENASPELLQLLILTLKEHNARAVSTGFYNDEIPGGTTDFLDSIGQSHRRRKTGLLRRDENFSPAQNRAIKYDNISRTIQERIRELALRIDPDTLQLIKPIS